MPTQKSPYDALKVLLSGQSPLDASNPNGIVQGRIGRENRLGEIERNKSREKSSQAAQDAYRKTPQSPAELQRNTIMGWGGPPSFASGAPDEGDGSAADLQKDLNKDPFAGKVEQDRVAGISKANDTAISQGFGGTSDFATHWNQDTGRVDDVQGVTGDHKSPSQRMAESGRQSELMKILSPVEVEREKGSQQRQTADEYAHIQALLNGDPSAGQPPMRPVPSHLTTQPNITSPGTPNPSPVVQPNVKVPGQKVYLDDLGNPQGQPGQSGSVGLPPIPDYKARPSFKMELSSQGPTISERPEAKLTAQEKQTEDAIRTSYRMMGELRDMVQSRNPQPAQTPAKAPGFFDQLGDVFKAQRTNALYGAGFPNPSLADNPHQAELADKINQIAELSKVISTRGLLGSVRNMAWINQIQNHVAKGGQPDATMLQRINTILEQYPKMVEDLHRSAQGAPMPFGQEQ